jgi:hypothetical protein
MNPRDKFRLIHIKNKSLRIELYKIVKNKNTKIFYFINLYMKS